MEWSDRMKIALVNTIRPQKDSGDGITEVTYTLYQALKKEHQVDLIYPIERSRRNDVLRFIYANTLFKLKLRGMLARDYDIIHIVNEEMGYAAKMAKETGTKAKVVISIFSLLRLTQGFHSGFVQNGYNRVVARGLREAVRYADLFIFSGITVQRYGERLLGKPKRSKMIYIGPARGVLLKAPPSKRKPGKVMNVGYVGSITTWKNVIFILRTAKLMKDMPGYKFSIYGPGAELKNMERYKEENGLSNVTFMGFAAQDRLLQIYDSFDVFFYPTLEEGTSLPVFDALVRRLPVILYRKTNLTDEVKKPCIIVDDERHAVLELERIRKNGYPQAKRLAAERYVRGFSWDRVIKETLEAYKGLLKD